MRVGARSQELYYDHLSSIFDCLEAGAEDTGFAMARRRFYARKNALILKRLKVSSADTVIDVGCGTGTLSRELSGRVACVIGIDVSEKMLQLAKQKCRCGLEHIEFIRADANRLPLANESINAYVSSNLIEHIGPLDVHFSEIHRVLAPNGKIVLSFPNGSTSFERLERVVAMFFKKLLSLDRKSKAVLESFHNHFFDACQSVAHTCGDTAFEHNSLSPDEVSLQLPKAALDVTSLETFGAIPGSMPDRIMLTRIPVLLEHVIESCGLFSMDLGSVLITAEKKEDGLVPAPKPPN